VNLPRGAAAFCAAFALVAAQRGPVIATDAGRVAGARVEAVDGFGGGVLPVWFERWKSASGIAVDP